MLILAVGLAGCQDDYLYGPDYIGEGESNINATISFHPLDPALDSRSPGNAVHDVNNLWIVMYSVNGDGEATFYKKILASSLPGYTCNQNGNSAEPSDVETGSNLGSTGETTPHASFSLDNVPYGRYKIYAVANVADLSDADCSSIDSLRATTMTWQTDVKANNAMFGYLTPATKQTSQGFDAPILYINQKQIDLHAWIKRLVSKVTVAIDPSDLKEAVRVYIKSITIHDIPRTCPLGMDNKPGAKDLIADGEELKYYTSETADNSQRAKWGIIVSKGSGVKGAKNHLETDNALYFFENMQGDFTGKGEQYNKEQQINELGTAIDKFEEGNDYKDRVLNGTYIEVVGYYESKNTEKVSSGPIRYRFMLGKNVTFNYNAERNYHYKLTLKLRGFANEADWHISYKEYDPQLTGPKDYYMTYLYGEELSYPLRFIPESDDPEDVKKYTVKAEIIENNWIPCDSLGNMAPSSVGSATDINGFAWNLKAYNSKLSTMVNGVRVPKNYAGFLSLCPNESEIIGAGIPYDPAKVTAGQMYGLEWLEDYYNKHPEIYHGSYDLATIPTSFDPIDKSVTFKVPMYTRNHDMVPSTDFSGNNPFPAFYRLAKIKYTLHLTSTGQSVPFKNELGESVMEFVANIFQVPRIENPKAIYRAHDNDDSFEIDLKILDGAGAQKYVSIKSDGPWRASIYACTEDFIEISRNGKTVKTKGEYITGSTDENIVFTYKPSSTINSNQTRCGIILVEYNDYTCTHYIFVRQGYHRGVKLGGQTWSCYNVYATANPANRDTYVPHDLTTGTVPVVLTASPLSIGSYLKHCQYNYSIREYNSSVTGLGWIDNIDGKNISTAYINSSNNVDNRDAKWGSIQGFAWYNYGASQDRFSCRWTDNWKAINIEKDVIFQVPTRDQFIALRDNCKFGFGIAYADGATKTAESFQDAHEYIDGTNAGGRSTRGSRVCVVYEPDGGRNILFPMGMLGQGRRSGPNGGRLTYSGLTSLLTSDVNLYRPMTYNIYRRPGALYWFRAPYTENKEPKDASWDLGYSNVVFNPYSTSSLGGWNDTKKVPQSCDAGSSSDALPIKLIYKTNDGI